MFCFIGKQYVFRVFRRQFYVLYHLCSVMMMISGSQIIYILKLSKIFAFFVMYFAFLSVNVTADWIKVDNIPAAFKDIQWLDVYFLESDPNFVWMCGMLGATMRTTDGGKSWKGVFIDGGNQLESIHFPEVNVGYTSGPAGVFKTIDGGDSWKIVLPGNLSEVWGCYFPTAEVGMAVGGGCFGNQKFYKTTDGGDSWNTFYGNEYNSGLTDVFLFSPDGEGYATSSGRMWRTYDGGWSWKVFSHSGDRDWQEELSFSKNSFLVPFSNGCTGGSVGGGIRMTTDFGDSWIEYNTGHEMFGTFLMDSLRGWACGWESSVYYTEDGGVNWELRNCGIDPGIDLDDLFFINDSVGFLVGDGAVYRPAQYDTLHPAISKTGEIRLCEGDSIVLDVSGDFNYVQWSDGSTSRTITAKSEGIYYVLVSNSSCDKTYSDTVSVVFHKPPDFELLADDDKLCIGDTTVLRLSMKFPQTEWSDGSLEDTLLVWEQGDYFVTITDENGCVYEKSIFISVLDYPVINLDTLGNTIFCPNDSLIIIADAGFDEYRWYNPPEDIYKITSENRLVVKSSGTFSVVVSNENGCETESGSIVTSFIADTARIQFIDQSGILSFGSIRIGRTGVQRLYLKNVSDSLIVFDNLFLFGNTVFSLPQSQFPLFLMPMDTVGINVHFAPVTKGESRDSLLIEDICEKYLIHLIGEGDTYFYDGDSRCDVPVRLTVQSIQPGYFAVSKPSPNPTQSKTTINYTICYEEDSNTNMEAGLYNSLGRKIAKLDIFKDNLMNVKGNIIESGYIEMNSVDLESAVYIVRISNLDNIVSVPVMIIR